VKAKSSQPSVMEAMVARARRATIPVRVKLDLTYSCNLRCVHCCVAPAPRPELNTDEVNALLGHLAESGCLFLSLSGGEIFLREDLVDILEEAHRLGFALRLMTNATLLPEDIVRRLRGWNVGEVAVSLYGDSPGVHDGITRVPGSFEKTVVSIRRLRDSGIRVKTALMLLKNNLSRFRQMADLADDLDAQWNLDATLFPRHDGSRDPLAHRVLPSDLEEVRAYVEARTGEIRRMAERREREDWLDGAPCGAGCVTCAISAYGDVLPCSAMPLPAGNVREQPFAEIWEESEVLRRVRSIRRRDLEVCSTCDLARYCVICLGLALAEDGDLLGPARFHCAEAAIHRAVFEKTYAENRSCSPLGE